MSTTLEALAVKIDSVREHVTDLSDALNEHMRQETENLGKLYTAINGIGSRQNSLESSFPINPAGQPDYHGHRVDHDTVREKFAEAKESRRKAQDVATEWLVKIAIGLAVFLVLGEKGKQLLGL